MPCTVRSRPSIVAEPAIRRALGPAARSATIAVLVWTGAAALGMPSLVGLAPNDVFAIAGWSAP